MAPLYSASSVSRNKGFKIFDQMIGLNVSSSSWVSIVVWLRSWIKNRKHWKISAGLTAPVERE